MQALQLKPLIMRREHSEFTMFWPQNEPRNFSKNMSFDDARSQLMKMLRCLPGFRHIRSSNADLQTERMPLLEVFIRHFLDAVRTLVKRGLRSDYVTQEDNLPALRGKLLVAHHIRHNGIRRERFFTRHDEFSQNRAENRLIHTALRKVLGWCRAQENQRTARELCFVFADVPLSTNIRLDMQHIRPDRGMAYYETALEWASLILHGQSPIASTGSQHAPSLLFPMDAVFEAYVQKHLARQLCDGFILKPQASTQHLVEHDEESWFRMKPDLLVKNKQKTHLVLDTKWKLLDANKNNARDKYQLSQADFYQMYAYGQHYLGGHGDIVLIYPKTDDFFEPLPVFEFPTAAGMRLWVLPFCVKHQSLLLPSASPLSSILINNQMDFCSCPLA
jgi:5-methylcytosine-specific restriction enzyme subunit McrC